MIIIGAILGAGFGALILSSAAELLSLPQNPFGLVSMIIGAMIGAVLGAEFMRRNI